MAPIWRDVFADNYYKSLDHRSFSFKQARPCLDDNSNKKKEEKKKKEEGQGQLPQVPPGPS